MLTVVGGKLTTYRSWRLRWWIRRCGSCGIATGGPGMPSAETDEEPLPGGETADLSQFRERGLELGIRRRASTI